MRFILVACAALLPGCGRQRNSGFAPGAKVLRLAEVNDIPTLDPAAGYDTVSWEFEQMLFSTLVRYGRADVKLHPYAALSWTVSPDARTFTFHLRHDVSFTNGRPVTSADFRYAIERVLDPKTSSKGMEYFRGIVGAAEFSAHRTPHLSGIETPDRWTISFHLAAPDPIFVDKLAMPFASAVPREAVEKWGNNFSRHPIGSGPFILKQWIGGQRIVIVKNPNYFIHGEPKLDAVVGLLGVSAELEWLKFEAGEIDVSAIPTAEFAYVMKTPSLKRLTLHQVTAATQYLGMNCQMPPFTDVRVRQALNYGIDKQKLIALLNGRGVVARGVMPPTLPGYAPDLTGYPYDPGKARNLLAAAGVSHDFAPELWLLADQTVLMIGQSIQQDLALIGVNLVLKPIALGPLLEAVRQPHTVPFMVFGWEADFPDPSNFLEVLFAKSQWGANNDTFYYNPQVDSILREAAPIADLKRRYALYQQAEKIIVADAPWILLYNPVAYVIRQPWVHDLVLNPMRPMRLETVTVSAHGE
ncbi:MAG: ABC transporter substrate-binding protein [Candidatus Binataceae bacterium]|nr:ABC transporter substrate-binding protein [Candidatus Binataceae bacterium]